MIKQYITYPGVIQFDPIDMTKKHASQASWKRMALILFDGEITEYYSWFMRRRYHLTLNKPLRGGHISFINDSVRDIKLGLKCNDEQADIRWDAVRDKWNGKTINVVLDPDIRTDTQFWWLNIPHAYRDEIHEIRKEIGLGRPFFGLHMTVGYANENHMAHSQYLHGLIQKFGNEYN